MPRTFLIRSTSNVVTDPGLENQGDSGEEESGSTLYEEVPYLSENIQSQDGPIDLSIPRSEKLRTGNRDKSSPELRAYKAWLSRTEHQSCYVPEVNNGHVLPSHPVPDKFVLSTTYKHRTRNDINNDVHDGNMSQNFQEEPNHLYAQDFAAENGCWSSTSHPFQTGDVFMDDYQSRCSEDPRQWTSSVPEDGFKKVRGFSALSEDRLFSMEGLTRMVEQETGKRPSRPTCMSLLEVYYAKAVEKRNIIRDLRRELQSSDLSEPDTLSSIFRSREQNRLRNIYQMDEHESNSKHKQFFSSPIEDIPTSTLDVHPQSGIIKLGNVRNKSYPSDRRMASIHNTPPMDRKSWNNEGSVGSETGTPPVISPQSSPSDITVPPPRHLPRRFSRSLPTELKALSKSHLIQQHPYPTTTSRTAVLSPDTGRTSVETSEELSILKNPPLRKPPQFLHKNSTASLKGPLHSKDVTIPPASRPIHKGRPKSSVPFPQQSDNIPTSKEYESALLNGENPRSCQEEHQQQSTPFIQNVSKISPLKITNDFQGPVGSDAAQNSSNDPSSIGLPIPPNYHEGGSNLPSISDKGPDEQKSQKGSDSTSLPNPKPPFSVAEDVPAQPTPTATSKYKVRCKYCSSNFSTEKAYTKHMADDHNETKPHICGFCGKGFHDKFDLKRHYRTHTGVRPYKCSVCSRAFTQRCSLETHVNKVHNMQLSFAFKERRKKIYVCEDCGNSVNDAFEHYLHMWAVHSRLAMPKRLRQKVMNNIKYILKNQNGGGKVGDELLADAQIVTQSIYSLRELSTGGSSTSK